MVGGEYNRKRVDAVRTLQNEIYRDAKEHGLTDCYVGMDEQARMKALILRIMDELIEAYGAAMAMSYEGFVEELADVVITTMSCAGVEHIDLADAIEVKRLRNIARPYLHMEET